MSELSVLRSQLRSLRRRRRLARWIAAWSAAALALLGTLCALAVVDILFVLSPWQRVVGEVTALLVVAIVFLRFSRPWLCWRESDLDLALLIERHQQLEGDLVAALEFDRPDAAHWGSAALRSAVIEYVALFAPHLNLLRGLTYAPIRRRTSALALIACGMLLTGVLWPGYWRSFANRLLLGTMHYPVRTQITELAINDQPVSLQGQSPVRVPYGRPVSFKVRAAGQLPSSGQATLRALAQDDHTSIELIRDEAEPRLYAGQIERLVDGLEYQLFLGDDWTEPARIEPIPLPVVTVRLEATGPDYASGDSGSLQSGSRQLAVVEGTRVVVRLECTNKSLAEARLTLGEREYAFVGADDSGRQWIFDEPGSPLAEVLEPIRYEVRATDEDGLEPPEAVQGFIRLKTDKPPRVSSAIVTQHVLPSGKPTITFGVADDYGLAAVRFNVQIAHEPGTLEERSLEVDVPPEHPKLLQGKYALDLSSMQLVKGDELKITLEAVDYRGRRPGKTALGQPLVLHVTDERGVLAAMSESDQRSAKQLDSIIQRQLGIGD